MFKKNINKLLIELLIYLFRTTNLPKRRINKMRKKLFKNLLKKNINQILEKVSKSIFKEIKKDFLNFYKVSKL